MASALFLKSTIFRFFHFSWHFVDAAAHFVPKKKRKKKRKLLFCFLCRGLFARGVVTVSCSLYHIVGSHLVCWTVCCLWPPHLFCFLFFLLSLSLCTGHRA